MVKNVVQVAEIKTGHSNRAVVVFELTEFLVVVI
jgi:hypothetical protein